MKPTIPLFLGVFAVMALSNSIVPVLPAFSRDPAFQGTVYAAYFLGALVTTLPAGILSDRYGPLTFVRAGLFVTFASGLLMSLTTDPFILIAARLLEGTGAGIFVASALSCVNAMPGHRQESGIYMALLNAGLVTGLFLAGWLDTLTADPAAGIILFTLLSAVSAGVSLGASETGSGQVVRTPHSLLPLVRDKCGIWYSSVILIGITGVAISLYPEYSMLSPAMVGFWTAAMSISTIAALILMAKAAWPPVPVIRTSAVLMGAGVLLTVLSPLGFLVLGWVAGMVIAAQLAALAGGHDQGAVMGLFSTSGYLGMTVLPFIAGLTARVAGYSSAFLLTAVLALSVVFFTQDSSCRKDAGFTSRP